MKRLILIMILLTMPLVSCQTDSGHSGEISLFFPEFPKLEKFEKLENGMIAVPESYIMKLADFKILYEELEKNYEMMYINN